MKLYRILSGSLLLCASAAWSAVPVQEFRMHLNGIKVLVDVSMPDGSARTYKEDEKVEELDEQGRPGVVWFTYWQIRGGGYLLVRHWLSRGHAEASNIIQAFSNGRHFLYSYGPTDLVPLAKAVDARRVALGHVAGSKDYPTVDHLLFLNGQGLVEKEAKDPKLGLRVIFSSNSNWALYSIGKDICVVRFSMPWERRLPFAKIAEGQPRFVRINSLGITNWGDVIMPPKGALPAPVFRVGSKA